MNYVAGSVKGATPRAGKEKKWVKIQTPAQLKGGRHVEDRTGSGLSGYLVHGYGDLRRLGL